MLVLTRKVGECLTIGEQVVLTVLAACGSQVRLGIEAPPEVDILREELCPAVANKTTFSPRKKKLPRIPRCGANRANKEAGR